MDAERDQTGFSRLEIRGDQLRQARIGRNLTIAEVALHLLMSAKQVRQLEEGDRTSFYSDQHAWVATQRYARLMQLDPDQIVNDYREKKPTQPSDALRLGSAGSELGFDASVSLAGRALTGSLFRSQFSARRRNLLLGAALLCTIAPFILFQFKTKTVGSKPPPSKGVKTAYSPSALTARVEATPKPPLEGAAGVSASSGIGLLGNSAMMFPAVIGIARAKGDVANLCNFEQTSFASLTPEHPSHTSNFLYVRSIGPASVCVQDADRNSERFSLGYGETRSFYGKPPFRVVSEQHASVKVFYQGQSVDLENSGPTIALKPSLP